MKRYLPWLLVAIVAAYALCAMYSWFGDAELRYWKTVGIQKLHHAGSLSEQRLPKVVFLGGSSCTFSIRPDVLGEAGVSSVNMGMAAGMGPLFLAAFGSSVVESNDVLMVCLEPNTLAEDFQKATGLGIRIAGVLKNPDWALGGDLTGTRLPLREQIAAVRPGGRHVVTMFFKALLNRPMYRYSIEEATEDGWCYTSYVPESPIPLSEIRHDLELSDDGRMLLAALVEWVRERGASVYYICPWQLTKPEAIAKNRSNHAQLMKQIAEFMPVIEDGYQGCTTNQAWFADTGYHLTPEGATARTACLIDLLPSRAGSPTH